MYTFHLIKNKFPSWIAWFIILLDFIWELPQNILGLIIKLFTFKYGSREVETYKQGSCIIQNWGLTSGISLGWFQFTNKNASKDMASHEVGHSIQSLYLGIFYLLIIGLPSIIWAGLIYPYVRYKYSYYDFYPEKWANKISGAYA